MSAKNCKNQTLESVTCFLNSLFLSCDLEFSDWLLETNCHFRMKLKCRKMLHDLTLKLKLLFEKLHGLQSENERYNPPVSDVSDNELVLFWPTNDVVLWKLKFIVSDTQQLEHKTKSPES